MKISLLNKFLYLLLSLSLFVGFYFGEDSSGSGGFVNDFNNTWQLVLAFQNNLFFDFTLLTIHFPLHYIILSQIQNLIEDQYILRFIFCLISLVIPYLFYLCLKTKFDKINKNLLYLFSLVIFLLPSFRSGAIWANSQITALIFFLVSLFFFIVWVKEEKYNKINSNLFLQIFFMSLAVYTRQLYAIIFLFFMCIYFEKFKLKNFIYVGMIVFLLALPGFFIVFNLPSTLTTSFDTKFYNSILINSSIISFFLIPIYLIVFFDKTINFNFLSRKNIFIYLFAFLFVLLLSRYFDYNFKVGGGFFLKLSVLGFDNFYLFFLSSLIGIILLALLSFEDKNNFILIIFLIFGFTSFHIFQKYYEPMFLMLLFTVMKSEIVEKFLKNVKNIFFLYVYIILYLLSAIANDIFQITKNIY
tara:strand:+ start:277 stop:1518 length:1242 start_codon:yes stop_codon:yes gene_type:complete